MILGLLFAPSNHPATACGCCHRCCCSATTDSAVDSNPFASDYTTMDPATDYELTTADLAASTPMIAHR